jgi:hypothetical protein
MSSAHCFLTKIKSDSSGVVFLGSLIIFIQMQRKLIQSPHIHSFHELLLLLLYIYIYIYKRADLYTRLGWAIVQVKILSIYFFCTIIISIQVTFN